jgi:hypothetical protein
LEELALLLSDASIELSPAASAAAALLHLDEPRAHVLLGDGSSSDKTDGWCLDTGATHHMTNQREFFTELDSDVRGSVKFGDAFGVEIKCVGSVIFAAESGEHRLLTGVYYIPSLRNSIISLGQLDESGSRVEIKNGVMRIWDRHHRLLAKGTRSTNRLCPQRAGSTTPLPCCSPAAAVSYDGEPSRRGSLPLHVGCVVLGSNGEAADAIRRTQAAKEAEYGRKLHTDNSCEFTTAEFTSYRADEGVQRHYFAPYSPQQNGVVERCNQTVVGMARALLKQRGMPAIFWGEAVVTAVYILNRSPTKALNGRTPYEA